MNAVRPLDPSPGELVEAIGYIRVSMKREEMISPEIQEAAIRACAERTGRHIIDWIVDLDKTGRNFNRRIMEAINRVRAGEAQEIIVWRFSRFGRNRKGNAINLAFLEDAGGRLISATEAADAKTAIGRFTRGMLLELAALESDQIGESWAEVRENRIARGLTPFGQTKFGYKRLGRIPDEENPRRTRQAPGEEERYVPDPEQAPALASAYRQYIAGTGGMVAIARRLSDEGHRNLAGNKFEQQTIRRILDSGFGAGLLQIHDPECHCEDKAHCRRYIHIPGAHEAVITEEEWEAYCARRKRNANQPPRSREATYSLTGLTKCGHCRSAAIINPSPTGTRCYCSRQVRKGDSPGHAFTSLSTIVAAVKEAVAEWAADIDAQARIEASRKQEHTEAKSAIERLEKELVAKDKALVKLARESAADDLLPRETWRKAAADAREERDQVAADLEAARKRQTRPLTSLAPVMSGLMEEWDTLPPGAINEMLRTLIRRVVIWRAGPRQRGPKGAFGPVPVRLEIHPVWEPDPWDDDKARSDEATSMVWSQS